MKRIIRCISPVPKPVFRVRPSMATNEWLETGDRDKAMFNHFSSLLTKVRQLPWKDSSIEHDIMPTRPVHNLSLHICLLPPNPPHIPLRVSVALVGMMNMRSGVKCVEKRLEEVI